MQLYVWPCLYVYICPPPRPMCRYHAMLMDGLKKMNGGLEILWQLNNFNFVEYFKGFKCTPPSFPSLPPTHRPA